MTFLSFTKLTLRDIDIVAPYLMRASGRACDNTVGGTFMWRDYFFIEFCIENGTLILKQRLTDGRIAYSMPIGDNVLWALDALYAQCTAENIPLVFCTVTDADLAIITSHFDATVIKEPSWSDYIYNASDIVQLSGRRYNGQRNHINYFMREHPEWSYIELNEDNVGIALEFFMGLESFGSGTIFFAEQEKVIEVLKNFNTYGMFGGMITISGSKVVGFAVGEIKDDTLFVHIEKSKHDERGASQMLTHEFAIHCVNDKIAYINREEDVGDVGLRTAKLSYHPCDILNKYTVTVQSKILSSVIK